MLAAVSCEIECDAFLSSNFQGWEAQSASWLESAWRWYKTSVGMAREGTHVPTTIIARYDTAWPGAAWLVPTRLLCSPSSNGHIAMLDMAPARPVGQGSPGVGQL
jgi:hypothetical protein